MAQEHKDNKSLYYPRQLAENIFIWTSACDGCIAYHYILPGNIWDRLTNGDIYTNCNSEKCFSSLQEAMNAIKNALKYNNIHYEIDNNDENKIWF